ncbi:4-galactosyl-N-acetylglucosaminide 3-alpha-L-fucosyltransferase 9 isoform X2 [Phyllostomus discolor]|uniref:4-galactosyl-N-acetylglucosaminide 3-alpha-L-fucosyltransferase 9 isoform X2 n=1 Tax=Phyllostomus discolor TaxID=89673 RepID=A0A7E6DN56_9CHIR|nr:4-galactosyl-N-acetylglucosaminide 3-alpha-L-fucosyltransferase 9 isoform X2 [Phyllostomus discolor]
MGSCAPPRAPHSFPPSLPFTLSDHLPFFPLSLPPAACLLPSPSPPSPSRGSSRFSGAGDGQRERAAQQLRIHGSPSLQLPAPPPPRSPSPCPPAPVPRLGERRADRPCLPPAPRSLRARLVGALLPGPVKNILIQEFKVQWNNLTTVYVLSMICSLYC